MKTNQENQIRLIDDKTIAIIARKSIHGTPEIIIDSDEWEKVKCLSWNVVLHNKKLYVRAHAKKISRGENQLCFYPSDNNGCQK